jgi:hypothetical protein
VSNSSTAVDMERARRSRSRPWRSPHRRSIRAWRRSQPK